MKSILVNIICILITALLTGVGTYTVFGQKVAQMEGLKADKEQVVRVERQTDILVERIGNSIQAQEELKKTIEKSEKLREETTEKVTNQIQKMSEKQSELIGKLEMIIKYMEKTSGNNGG